MNPKERKNYLLQYIEDCVVDCIEDAILDKFMSSEEGEWVYKTVGHRGLRGLFRRYIGKPKEKHRMPLINQLVLFKDIGQVVPIEVVQTASEVHDKMVAMAAVSENTLAIVRATGKANYNTIHATMETYKDCPLLVVFGSDKDNAQPYVIIEDEAKTPILAMFIQGDVSVHDKLKKRLVKEYKAAGSLDELFDMLLSEEDDTSDEIQNLLTAGSALLVIGNNGRICHIENAPIEQEFEWGAAYGDPQPEDGGTEQPATETETKPKPGGFAGLNLTEPVTNAPDLAEAASAHERDDDVPVARIQNAKTRAVEAVTFKHSKEPWLRCPDGLGKDGNHEWHMEKFGVVPENWKKRPYWPARMLLKRTEVNLNTLKDTASAAALATKDTAPKHVRGLKFDEADVKRFNSEFGPKIFGSNAEEIFNPANLLVVEGNFPKVWEALGRKSALDFLFPYLARLSIAKESPEDTALIWGNLQTVATHQAARIAELEANILKLEEELTKPKEPAKPAARQLKL